MRKDKSANGGKTNKTVLELEYGEIKNMTEMVNRWIRWKKNENTKKTRDEHLHGLAQSNKVSNWKIPTLDGINGFWFEKMCVNSWQIGSAKSRHSRTDNERDIFV